MDISHEELITIFNEKDKYEKMKDNLRSENEIMRFEKCEIKDLENKNKK